MINAPKGAIRKGQTLTLETGAPRRFPALEATSLAGGPYTISTSQGEPTRPIKVKLAYDRDAPSVGQPLVLHGLDFLGNWVPEETTVNGSFVSASLSSLSPIDVVDGITWAAGDFTGNRTDLPNGCGTSPDWIDWLTPPYRKNDSLPACVGSESDDSTLYIHVANNRGYAQFLTVSNARIDLRRSRWSDSLEGLFANQIAGFGPGDSLTRFLLAPGSHAVLALDRPAQGFGETTVSMQVAPQGSSAMAAMGWALIKKIKGELGERVAIANCVIAKVDESISHATTADAAIKLLYTCVNAASSGLSKKAGDALKKIARAVLVVDFFYKLVDLLADEAYPAGIKLSIHGRNSTNPNIRIGNLNLGALPAGHGTVQHLTATGGTAPYSFHISHAASNVANVPPWVQLAPDGTLTIDPPAGANASVGFYVYATDATGQSSPFEREAVTFSVAGKGNTEMGWTASLTPEPSGAYLEGYAWLSSVSCAAPGFCVAVGDFPTEHGYDGLIETLGGEGWAASTAPAPSDVYQQEGNNRDVTLNSVSCSSASACTAVGHYAYNEPTHIQGISQKALVEEFSNGSWIPTALPLLPDADQDDGVFKSADLETVACPAVDFCAAAGNYSVHPDGQEAGLRGLLATSSNGTWSQSAAPLPVNANGVYPPSFTSMACSAPEQCVAVGTYPDDDSGTSHGLIEGLSGGSWTATEAPLPADASGDFSELHSAACSPTGFCIAVGWYEKANGDLQGLLDTFSNGAWTATVVPLPANARPTPANRIGSSLSAAACSPSGTSCVAGGSYEDIYGITRGLVSAFDGSSWTTEEAPLPPGALGAGIASAACWKVGSCVGLGWYGGSSEPFGSFGAQGLIETLSDGSWTATMAPLPESDLDNYTIPEHVSCAADGTCAAIGTFETKANGLSHNRSFIETRQPT